jgi:hypothetical protein
VRLALTRDLLDSPWRALAVSADQTDGATIIDPAKLPIPTGPDTSLTILPRVLASPSHLRHTRAKGDER